VQDVDTAWEGGDDEEIILKQFNIHLTRRHLRFFRPNQELSDEVGECLLQTWLSTTTMAPMVQPRGT
jgi:hypothetical protein